jgi:putative serine protease PepD
MDHDHGADAPRDAETPDEAPAASELDATPPETAAPPAPETPAFEMPAFETPASEMPASEMPASGTYAAEVPYVSDGSPAFDATDEFAAAGEPPTAPTPTSAAAAPSWAWSTSGAATTPAPAVELDAPAGDNGSPREKRGVRSALVGGIAGALVGALVAGGLVVAFDDDPRPQPAPTQVTTDDSARPATVVVEPGDIRSILEAARPAVVSIDVGGAGQLQGTGTGFIVDSSGVIVTNAHVVSDFDEVTVHLANGDEVAGEVVGSDPRLDLAVVQIDRDGLPTLELGNSDDLQVGDAVVAIGNALGISEGSGATVTTGIISGLDRVVDLPNETLFNAIQTDAAINPGNSGGPLVDMNGRVIGINTAIASPETANNVGFAISISSARPIIDDLRAGREPQIAFLGVSTEPVTPDQTDELGVEQGAIVAEISEDSPASDAGVRTGDVIVQVAGTEIDSIEDVASEVRKHRPGDQIDIVIVRDGERQTLSVTLGERPDDF